MLNVSLIVSCLILLSINPHSANLSYTRKKKCAVTSTPSVLNAAYSWPRIYDAVAHDRPVKRTPEPKITPSTSSHLIDAMIVSTETRAMVRRQAADERYLDETGIYPFIACCAFFRLSHSDNQLTYYHLQDPIPDLSNHRILNQVGLRKLMRGLN